MRLNNNEITIVRGETFSIDRTIVNRDGSPYIVSSRLLNPAILITISDSLFLSSSSKIDKYFLDLSDIPRFEFTNLFSTTRIVGNNKPNDFPNDLTLINEQNKLIFCSYFDKADDICGIEPFDALFTDSYLSNYYDSESNFKYWKPDSLQEGSSGQWTDYELRFVKTFSSLVTSKWEPKTYYYSIELVSGKNPQEGLCDYSQVILPPCRLNVLSNLKGGL